MQHNQITPDRKKKIKTVLSMMNKQNQRLIPIMPPLIKMMDMETTDEELDYLIQMGTGTYDYEKALKRYNMSEGQFKPFFDKIKRKGLVHVEMDGEKKERYRLNAIAVGWYEVMMHYMVGNPKEKEFSENWNEFFKSFKKFNFSPLRNLQNIVLRNLLKPTQDTALMNFEIEDSTSRKTIPIGVKVTVPDSKVYPTFHVNKLIEEYGKQDAIYVIPCVCRRGNKLLDSPCDFDIPNESCIAFGSTAEKFAEWGYGRHISKEEALDILKTVRDHGAVHSVIHERDDFRLPVAAICNCCWDCCGILKPYNMGAIALKYRVSYTARIKQNDLCKGCGNCEKYCPTTAMKLNDQMVTCNIEKCIGCGQCAYQCRQNNIELYPDEREVYLPLLKKTELRVMT